MALASHAAPVGPRGLRPGLEYQRGGRCELAALRWGGLAVEDNTKNHFDPETATPVAVVAEAVARLLAEDYSGAAELYHSDLVRGCVERAWMSAQPRVHLLTVEDLLRQDPAMPREVAEYEVKRAANRFPPPPSFPEIHGVESEEELAALEPREVLARQLWAADLRLRFRAHLDQLAATHPRYRDQLAEQKAALRPLWYTLPLGSVESGDRTYVVLGDSGEWLVGRKKSMPDDGLADLVVLRRDGGGWRISSSLGLGGGFAVGTPHVAVKDEDGKTVVLS